jgi:hypothetical protein
VRALRDGLTVVILSEDLVPGDVVFLTAGDDVPADCRLVEAVGRQRNPICGGFLDFSHTGAIQPIDCRGVGGKIAAWPTAGRWIGSRFER